MNDLELNQDIETEAQEECPDSEDGTHCDCWWDRGARCCYCGTEAQLEE